MIAELVCVLSFNQKKMIGHTGALSLRMDFKFEYLPAETVTLLSAVNYKMSVSKLPHASVSCRCSLPTCKPRVGKAREDVPKKTIK